MRARSSETYALSKRGEPGLACDLQGVTLGPVALVEKIGDGPGARYRRRPLAEIEKALKLAYGNVSVPDLACALTGLEAAARALNRRRLFDAAVAAREMRLQPLSPQAVTQLLAATGLGQVPLAKAFNPDQPRVPAGNPGGGQWAGGGEETGGGPGTDLAQGTDSDKESSGQGIAQNGVRYAENNLVATDASPAAASPDWRNTAPPSDWNSQQVQRWDKFKQALAGTSGLSDLERQAFLDTFRFEGGKDPKSTAVAGLLQDTVTEAIKNGGITGARANATPQDLTTAQIVQGYKYYLDTALSRVGGISAIDQFSDPQTAVAVADTLFREGPRGGAKLLVAAADSVLDKLNPAFSSQLGLSNLPVPDSVGPQTLNTLVTLSNAGLGLQLRGELATLRARKYDPKKYGGEIIRAYYFR